MIIAVRSGILGKEKRGAAMIAQLGPNGIVVVDDWLEVGLCPS